jgi:hypothetical protein
MQIQLFWDESISNVIHYRFQQGWTWEDFRQTALEEHRQGEALAGIRYDIIADLHQATIPSGTGFTNVVRLFDQGPKNRVMIVVVGSPLARAMIQIGVKLYPQVKNRFHAVTTIEDARQLIVKMRSESHHF